MLAMNTLYWKFGSIFVRSNAYIYSDGRSMSSLRMLEPTTTDLASNQLKARLCWDEISCSIFGLKLLSSFPYLLYEFRPKNIHVEVKWALLYCLIYSENSLVYMYMKLSLLCITGLLNYCSWNYILCFYVFAIAKAVW